HGGARGVHRGGHAARDLLDQRDPAVIRSSRFAPGSEYTSSTTTAPIEQGTGTRAVATPVPRRDHSPEFFMSAIRAVATVRSRGQRGFTLIELLVVIIVLGLLVGLVGPRLFGRVGQSKQAAARAQIELLGAGLDQYRLDAGSYPTTSQGLDALQRNPGAANWNGPDSSGARRG